MRLQGGKENHGYNQKKFSSNRGGAGHLPGLHFDNPLTWPSAHWHLPAHPSTAHCHPVTSFHVYCHARATHPHSDVHPATNRHPLSHGRTRFRLGLVERLRGRHAARFSRRPDGFRRGDALRD